MHGHPILTQFCQHFAAKNSSAINYTKKTPKDTIQGSNMAPQGHPRTPNDSEMTPQIAPKSTLGAPRAPTGAPQAADVAPKHNISSKSWQNTRKWSAKPCRARQKHLLPTRVCSMDLNIENAVVRSNMIQWHGFHSVSQEQQLEFASK